MRKKIIIRESQYNKLLTLLRERVSPKENNVTKALNSVKPNNIINLIDTNKVNLYVKVNTNQNNEIRGVDVNDDEVIIYNNSFNPSTNELRISRANNPNDILVKLSDIKINDEKEDEGNEEKEKGEAIDKNDELFQKYYNEIINDPNVKKAFYTSPSTWDYFVSALKNKEARGSGILPAYDLINKYMSSRTDSKLPGFSDKENKTASFYLFEKIVIPYTNKINGNKEEFSLDVGTHTATVRQFEAGLGDVKVLTRGSSGGNYGYKITVKKPTEDFPDDYWCDVYVNNRKVEENKYRSENVKLRFINSDGYTSSAKQKTQNKQNN